MYMYFSCTSELLKGRQKRLNASKEQKLCICAYSLFPQWVELKDRDKEEQHTLRSNFSAVQGS